MGAHAGINASDINYTAGRYFGSAEVAAKRLPFDAGFESVGAVAAAGPDVSREYTSNCALSAWRIIYATCLDLMQRVVRAELMKRASAMPLFAWWLDCTQCCTQ